MLKSELAEARNQKGATQLEVAEAAKITETSYQRIEYGQQTPKLKTAFRIAEYLGKTVDELFKELYQKNVR